MSGPRSQGQKVSRPAARYRPGKAPQLPPSASAGTAKRTSRIAAPPPRPEDDSEDEEEDEREDKQRRDVAITDVVAGTEALRSGADRETAGIVIQEGQSTKVDIQFKKSGRASATQVADDDSSEYGEWSKRILCRDLGLTLTFSLQKPTRTTNRRKLRPQSRYSESQVQQPRPPKKNLQSTRQIQRKRRARRSRLGRYLRRSRFSCPSEWNARRQAKLRNETEELWFSQTLTRDSQRRGAITQNRRTARRESPSAHRR